MKIVTDDTLCFLPRVTTPVELPMRLALICQRWLVAPDRLAEAGQLPRVVIADALLGKPVSQEAARRLLLGLFRLTGWLWVQGEVADLVVRRPTLAELLNRHRLTAVMLARLARVSLMEVQDILRRRVVKREVALRVLGAFAEFGFEYRLEDVDMVIFE